MLDGIVPREETRVAFLSEVARLRGVQSYLEIGVRSSADCFDHIPAARKFGVDPNGSGTHAMMSDQFFAEIERGERFDLIFIDGDHRHPQVLRDVENALRHLAPHGVIAMHDCLPPSSEYEQPYLCGTAWRAFVSARERPYLDGAVGNFDFGVGVLRCRPNGAPVVLEKDVNEMTWTDLDEHREEWLRLMPFDQLLDFAVK